MKFRFDTENELLITTDATRVEYFQLKQHLTRFVKNHRFQPRVKMGVWDGSVSHFKDGQIALGLWKECLNLCKLNNWKFEIENKKDFPIDRVITPEKLEVFANDFFKDHKLKNGEPFMPYDHQLMSAYNIIRNRYCIAEVATGGGKSLIFALVMFYVLNMVDKDAKFLLIVPNISLVTQFHDDILDYLWGFQNEFKDRSDVIPVHIEEIMSDKPRRSEHEANLFIGTIQSLEKRPKQWFEQFYGVGIDECLHPDTMITKHDGSQVKITEVKVGDLVKTINDETGETEIKPVDYVYKNLSKGNQMYELEMENGSIIKITGNHKVRLSTGEWKRVDELKEGDDVTWRD